MSNRTGAHPRYGAARKSKALYDVVSQGEWEDTREVWFNRATGMADLVLWRKKAPKDGNPFSRAAAIAYQNVAGIYYPKTIDDYRLDLEVHGRLEYEVKEMNGLRP